jgi:hypothetical protein
MGNFVQKLLARDVEIWDSNLVDHGGISISSSL